MKNVVTKEVRIVPLTELFPDPDQPRQDFDEVSMDRLRDSIEQKGIMNPIVVEPKVKGKYLIVDGERRYRIASRLRFKTVPVNVLSGTLSVSDRNIMRFQLQETHKQWSVFEKAEALLQLKEALDLTNQELAKALALSRATVDHYLSILTFAPKARKQLTKYKLPFTILEAMAYSKNIMPEKIAKSVPDWVENVAVKYNRGILKSHMDLREINRLIRKGEYKVVTKFLQSNNYTASNAMVDSGDERTKLSEQILHRAKKLINDLEIADKNDIKFDAETNLTLDRLAKLL